MCLVSPFSLDYCMGEIRALMSTLMPFSATQSCVPGIRRISANRPNHRMLHTWNVSHSPDLQTWSSGCRSETCCIQAAAGVSWLKVVIEAGQRIKERTVEGESQSSCSHCASICHLHKACSSTRSGTSTGNTLPRTD